MPFLEAGGHRLEYEWIAGEAATSPVLLFLHEGLGSAAMWRDFPGKLAALTSLPALVYSRWGYGNSEPLGGPRGLSYMHDEALITLPALRAALSLREVILIGHSDGASIALIHAGAGAQGVRALILEAPHVFVEPVSVAGIEAARDAFDQGDLRERLARYHADVEGAFRGWNEAWLDPRFRAWSITEYLASIRVPVLAIQGEEDAYGTLAQLDAIARGIGGPFTRLILPRCGHAPHREREAETLRAMADMIRGKPPLP
ncbi:MAG TPA: alpha/beta hydrolase [Stellaceae bacterium]|nr:alpha/beta hydrolase [Stellaceae bacterium]